MPETAADRCVADIERLLWNLSGILQRRERDLLAAHQITPPQYEALLALKDSDGLTMGELCRRLHLACSTATDLTDRMERGGLVERVRDAADRRVVRVRLLPKGASVIEQVRTARHLHLAGEMAALDAEAKEGLIQSLMKLNSLIAREV